MKPPTIKQMVAINDGSCKFERPIIACPEVHPPAYRVPNPTKKPPPTISIKPLSVNKAGKLKSCSGTKELKSVIP